MTLIKTHCTMIVHALGMYPKVVMLGLDVDCLLIF